MINYPVHYDEELGGIYDKSCHFICDVSSNTCGNEMVKRINMHDELSLALKDLIEIVGELEEFDAERINKSFRWICEIHQNAIKVLEKCK